MKNININKVKAWCDFRLLFLFRAIFDWRSPTAYIFAFTFEILATSCAMTVGLVLLIHAVGSCWILIAFIDDIKTEMSSLNAQKRTGIHVAKLYANLIVFLRLRKELKQLSQCILCDPISMISRSSFRCPYISARTFHRAFHHLTDFNRKSTSLGYEYSYRIFSFKCDECVTTAR